MERVSGPDFAGGQRIDNEWLARSERLFQEASGSTSDKLAAFPRFVDRSSLSRFLIRYELFKKVLRVQGSIIECGVFRGAGLFSFAQFSALLEPLNHRRRIIGFDTFEGFPSIAAEDAGSTESQVGGYRGADETELRGSIELYDVGRPMASIPKVHLVPGDFMQTGPQFLEANPHMVVALLYIDFDLRDPTSRALELFLPRMPAGSVLAFDDVNVAEWPGETLGLLDALNLRQLRLERMPMTSICWAKLSGHE